MTTKTSIVNQALISLGELVISDIDTDITKRGTTLAALYDSKLQYLFRKFNWKFAIKRTQLDVTEYYLDFDTATAAFVIGETITGATGSGVVTRVVLGDDTTEGRFYLKDVTTGFVDDESLTGSIAGSDKAVANGVEVAATPLNEFSYMFAVPEDYIRLIELYPNYLSYRIEGNFILCDESDTLDIQYVYLVTDPNEFDASFVECFAALLAREGAIQITDSMRKRDAMDALFEDKLGEARFLGSIEDDLDEIQPDDRQSWLIERY